MCDELHERLHCKNRCEHVHAQMTNSARSLDLQPLVCQILTTCNTFNTVQYLEQFDFDTVQYLQRFDLGNITGAEETRAIASTF